jgi:threonylcarbamoyladenosine tRNA methylthiotransferase MtaB
VFSLSFQTLGCKLNQFESESLAAAFTARGFVLAPRNAGADMLVINTCTVTSMAEQKARRLIRKALRDNPRSCLIVTGCYAQMDAAGLAALEAEEPGFRGRVFVISGDMKSALLDLPGFLTSPEAAAGRGGELPELLRGWTKKAAAADRFAFNAPVFSFHSRAFLKIQDGCGRRCAYCRVSLARGPSVSLEPDRVLSRLKALEAGNYGEAVLTGVNISQYRGGPAAALPELLSFLLEGTERIKLRLSSLEPEIITPDFARVLAHPRIRPHFHLSVQSGSLPILARMRRPYGPEEVAEAAALLRSVREDPFLGCDIIAGFPGETKEAFGETYALCREIGFAWIHPFPYSPRPGTEAWGFTGGVPPGETALRVQALLALAREGRGAYIGRWVGKSLEALIQAQKKKNSGYLSAVSDNYLRLMIRGKGGTPPGGEIRCRISASCHGESGFDAAAEQI